MKKIITLFLISLIINLPIEVRLNSQENVISSVQAKIIASSYFNLLTSGNTSAILNLLGGRLLKQREKLLRDNPQYGQFLKDRYKNARFTITGDKLINNNTQLALDVLIVFNNKDQIETRLIFEMEGGQLKISSEENPLENKIL
jgi:hypothetical protein